MATIAKFMPKLEIVDTIDLGCWPWRHVYKYRNDIISMIFERARENGYTIAKIEVTSDKSKKCGNCMKKHCISYKRVIVYGFHDY